MFLSPVAKSALNTKKIKRVTEEKIFDRYKRISLERLDSDIKELERRIKTSDNALSVEPYNWKITKSSRAEDEEVIEVCLKIGRVLADIGLNPKGWAEKKLLFIPIDALQWLIDVRDLLANCRPEDKMGTHMHKLAIGQSYPTRASKIKGKEGWLYSSKSDLWEPATEHDADEAYSHMMIDSL